jgi:hypothetical protein
MSAQAARLRDSKSLPVAVICGDFNSNLCHGNELAMEMHEAGLHSATSSKEQGFTYAVRGYQDTLDHIWVGDGATMGPFTAAASAKALLHTPKSEWKKIKKGGYLPCEWYPSDHLPVGVQFAMSVVGAEKSAAAAGLPEPGALREDGIVAAAPIKTIAMQGGCVEVVAKYKAVAKDEAKDAAKDLAKDGANTKCLCETAFLKSGARGDVLAHAPWRQRRQQVLEARISSPLSRRSLARASTSAALGPAGAMQPRGASTDCTTSPPNTDRTTITTGTSGAWSWGTVVVGALLPAGRPAPADAGSAMGFPPPNTMDPIPPRKFALPQSTEVARGARSRRPSALPVLPACITATAAAPAADPPIPPSPTHGPPTHTHHCHNPPARPPARPRALLLACAHTPDPQFTVLQAWDYGRSPLSTGFHAILLPCKAPEEAGSMGVRALLVLVTLPAVLSARRVLIKETPHRVQPSSCVYDGATVPDQWLGPGIGAFWCNQCLCGNGKLVCTTKNCGAKPAETTSSPTPPPSPASTRGPDQCLHDKHIIVPNGWVGSGMGENWCNMCVCDPQKSEETGCSKKTCSKKSAPTPAPKLDWKTMCKHGDVYVPNGWTGKGQGEQWCNQCFCSDSKLSCSTLKCGNDPDSCTDAGRTYRDGWIGVPSSRSESWCTQCRCDKGEFTCPPTTSIVCGHNNAVPTRAPTFNPSTCVMDDKRVDDGWSGKGAGKQFCNHCSCQDGNLFCTKEHCRPECKNVACPRTQPRCPMGKLPRLQPNWKNCCFNADRDCGYPMVVDTKRGSYWGKVSGL